MLRSGFKGYPNYPHPSIKKHCGKLVFIRLNDCNHNYQLNYRLLEIEMASVEGEQGDIDKRGLCFAHKLSYMMHIKYNVNYNYNIYHC